MKGFESHAFGKAESAEWAKVMKDSGATVDRGYACADRPHPAIRDAGRSGGAAIARRGRTMAGCFGIARRWRFPQRG
jgi:hypothetical protein